MGILSGAANAYFAYKFLRILTQKWEDMDAFKYGIIDKNGNVLKKARDLKTVEEKESYTIFNRLVFNIKRLMEKIPGGSSTIGSYAAALYLLKEHSTVDDDDISMALEELQIPPEALLPVMSESYLLNEQNEISPGSYSLTTNVASGISGEVIGKKGHTVVIEEQSAPIGTILGIPIYEATHKLSNQKVYITIEDIRR